MSAVRPGLPGATRSCPHCKTIILDTASVCPGCRHHLRFDAAAGTDPQRTTSLAVEGSLRAERPGEAIEYTMVLVIRNERGDEVNRQVIGVGALEGEQRRSFSVTVETNVVPAGKGRRR
ncbi:hypothetical protein [Cognatilysobacter lacus]|uniref:Uncharacterized protein n=1 Tax=Cognatilysobacter lacus TaxID=1643323 RepID=A0A5D8YYG6_9GAMM|nr:hypothetical protein [Lysobacter lacus]TZF87765.1 hypothetical protein FW784_10720 [Lysobacter lacus]